VIDYEARYKDPQHVYVFLSRAMLRQKKETEGDYPVLPMIGLIEVLNVEAYSRHRNSNLRIWAKAVRADGRVDVLEYDENETMASAPDADPGYFESSIRWQNLDDQGKPIEWAHLYTAEMVSMGAMVRSSSPESLARRMAKMKYLYYALTPQVRVRVVHKTLEINKGQHDEGMRQLGRVLLGLAERDAIWDTTPKPDGEMSPKFPTRGH
jgi:hypothetical protein